MRLAGAIILLLPLAATAQPGRMFSSGQWVEVRRITDDDGRLFLAPLMMAARNDTIFVYDGGTAQVLAITPAGRVAWRVGRAGKGPQEFATPVDLQFGPGGELHVLDAEVARITTISPAGRITGMFSVSEPFHRIVPHTTGWWGYPMARSELLVWIDRARRAAPPRRVPAPNDIAGQPTLLRELHVAALHSGGSVLTPIWVSRVLAVSADGEVDADIRGPGVAAFPVMRSYAVTVEGRKGMAQRIDPRARVMARALAANDTMALVLVPDGAGRDAPALDRYDLRLQRYVESTRFAALPVKIVLMGSRLVTLELEPVPALVVYEWRLPVRR